MIRPIITIEPDNRPLWRRKLSNYSIGITLIILLVLSLKYPFARNLYIFTAYMLTIFSVGILVALTFDADNGVRRAYVKAVDSPYPIHLSAFFVVMIAASAGLKMAYYTVAVCWCIMWFCSATSRALIRKTMERKPDENSTST